MRNKKQKDSNYLDFVPKRNENFSWETDESGTVVVSVEHKGFFDKIAQKYFGKPAVSQIHLEEMGSFIWPLIDGERDVMQIGKEVKEHFGEKAEPLYPRLVQYMAMLENQGFVIIEKH
ncbi:MAG: PqqD family protein [Lachnospiraceae bacterium]|nr:PqqD family protein [Lachnospiraceae bacterium]